MRRTIALLLLAMTAWLLWSVADRGADGVGGTFALRVDGPDGVLHVGNVPVQEATPFSVLATAAERAGFDVIHQGAGASLFVTSIGGHANHGAGGWCFLVGANGDWTAPHVGAGAYTLLPGQAVWWRYEAGGCPDGA